MIVVSDTSPVLNLARIGRLELLPFLYKQVLIPSAVFDELTASKRDLPPLIDLASEPWLIVATPNDQKHVLKLREELDHGEAEAIVLAIERRADLLLMDERRGRRTAAAAGLTVTGLLGVVAKAKSARACRSCQAGARRLNPNRTILDRSGSLRIGSRGTGRGLRKGVSALLAVSS